jgi:hypothetical protein
MDILIFRDTFGEPDEALLYIGDAVHPGPGYLLTDTEHDQIRKIVESVIERRDEARKNSDTKE